VSVALALAVATLPACSGDHGRDEGGRDPSPGTASSTATTAPAPASDLPEPVDAVSAGGHQQPGGTGDWVMGAGSEMWVADLGPGLVAFDAGTGRRTAGLHVGPVHLGMEAAGNLLWLCTADGQLVSVDARRRTLRTRTDLGVHPLEESSVTAGGGEVFVPTQARGWSAVVADARTGAVRRRIRIPQGTGGLRYGFGSLWAAVGDRGRLVRLDPATGEVRQQYVVGDYPVFVSVGPDRVWVMSHGSGSVSAVDPRSGEVTEVVVDTGRIEGGDIVATPDAVWVRVTDVLAARVDPDTMTVTDRISPRSGSGGIGVNGSDLWMSAHDVRTLWRFPGGA
jgi:streptogramin lyase